MNGVARSYLRMLEESPAIREAEWRRAPRKVRRASVPWGWTMTRKAYWEHPQGDAGDAIDFACDHISPMPKMRWFLEDWRAGRADEWPDYMRWLKVQQDNARASSLNGQSPTEEME